MGATTRLVMIVKHAVAIHISAQRRLKTARALLSDERCRTNSDLPLLRFHPLFFSSSLVMSQDSNELTLAQLLQDDQPHHRHPGSGKPYASCSTEKLNIEARGSAEDENRFTRPSQSIPKHLSVRGQLAQVSTIGFKTALRNTPISHVCLDGKRGEQYRVTKKPCASPC